VGYSWRNRGSQEGSSMSLALGFFCSDGIVLAADSEMTTDAERFEDDKAWYLRFPADAKEPTLKIGIVGAGNLQNLRSVTDYIRRSLTPDMTLDVAEHAVTSVLHEFYRDHVYPFGQAHEREHLNVWLLVGIVATDGRKLLSTELTTVAPVDRYKAIGIGTELANFLVKRSGIETAGIQDATFLSSQILQHAKRHVRDVNGPTRIIVLNPMMVPSGFVRQDTIRGHEQFADALDTAIRPVMFGATARNLSDLEFTNQLEQLKGSLMEARNIKRNITFHVGTGHITSTVKMWGHGQAISPSQPPNTVTATGDLKLEKHSRVPLEPSPAPPENGDA
jgi:20S proteasome alpha/beta subunit